MPKKKTDDLAELKGKMFALQVVMVAMIDTHPAPVALDKALATIVEKISVNVLGTATLYEIGAVRAQLKARIGATVN
ncbi:MAG: hypothetical protein AB7E72_12440 [Lysobacterales bacterium]